MKRLIVSLSLLFCQFGWAATTQFNELLDHMKSMQAGYEQTIYDNRHKAIASSTGRLFLQRPGKLRLDIAKPIPQVIVANGSKLTIYDPDLEQAVIRRLSKIAGEAPALLLSQSHLTIEKDFVITEKNSHDNGLRWFLFTPKKQEHIFEYVEIGFYQTQLSAMRLKDSLGHFIDIRFTNIKINQPIPASQFTLHIPSNVDVIDETRK